MDLGSHRATGTGAGQPPFTGLIELLSSAGLACLLLAPAAAACQEGEDSSGSVEFVAPVQGSPQSQGAGLQEPEGPPQPRRVESGGGPRRDSFVQGPVLETLGAGGRCRTDYTIRARVEPIVVDGQPRFDLSGRETLRWTNNTSDSVEELWFHLYLNAFANNRTTHLTAAGGRLRGHLMTDGWGWSEIESIRLRRADGSELDLAPSLTWEQPTDGNTADRTVFRVELPEAVEPGETAEVLVDWSSRLPRVRRRTGTKDDFLLVAQWFPKLGVYEEGRGWNCHQFHAFSEWYADYGTYDVVLDLPAEFADRVYASGVETRELARGDRVEVSFAAPSMDDRERPDPESGRELLVHDFMWTADPDFYTKSKTFRFQEWADRYPEEVERARRAFGEDFVPGLREVTVEALIQPEREVQADRHIHATCAALFFYGLWFGEYPFERITVVDPAWGASAAGGMEYPTIFTAGTRLFSHPWMHSPEGVTVHEAGHQWFYMLSGNNEFEAAWLDEGLNSYADSEVIARVWGDSQDTTSYGGVPLRGVRLLRVGTGSAGSAMALRRVPVPPLEWLGLDDFAQVRPVRSSGFVDWWRDQPLLTAAPRESDPRWSDRSGYLSNADRDPIDNWAWNSVDRGSHYTNTYARTATVLRSTPAFLSAASGQDGDSAFLRGMRAFARDWRFGHPYPDDFFNSFEQGTGLDLELGWYFDEMFRGTGTVDWSIGVSQRREGAELGAFMDEDGRFVIEEAGSDPSADEAQAGDGELGLEPAEQPGVGGAGDGGAGDGGDIGGGRAAAAGGAEDASPAATGGPTTLDGPAGSDSDDSSTESAASSDTDGPDRPWTVEVTVERSGSLSLPVLVRLEFEDGAIEEYTWTREEQLGRRWIKLTYASASKLKSAAVDPDRGYFIDTDRSNNEWYADSESVTALRWAERVFGQAAHAMHWYKGFGG
ncbi:M1 family metallopeptidase [Engelhardtia mirabilis]|uniref:Peptidase family M1 n=1 Tax=Engelhardtia mirabilis TaxID=2528011 RepID=A0A518BSP8_9BACT|nr:Peptidase family M1 [Planctomycetes bacterium Pla133]QDV04319.1 Peptidase family M1 [Planctomycetes bacterium Pla86]